MRIVCTNIYRSQKCIYTSFNTSFSHIPLEINAYFHEITIIIDAHCPQIEYLLVLITYNKKDRCIYKIINRNDLIEYRMEAIKLALRRKPSESK